MSKITATERERIIAWLARHPIAAVHRLSDRSYLTLARLAAAQERGA